MGFRKLDDKKTPKNAAMSDVMNYAITGEYPPNMRAINWGKAIGQAGKKPLTLSETERLQHIVIRSNKLKNMGIRKGKGFIDEHDRETFTLIPDHISAKAKDISSLINGLLNTNNLLQNSNYDPILTATNPSSIKIKELRFY